MCIIHAKPKRSLPLQHTIYDLQLPNRNQCAPYTHRGRIIVLLARISFLRTVGCSRSQGKREVVKSEAEG